MRQVLRIKILVITFMLICISSRGQFIDRITFNYGISISELEWNYQEDYTFPLYYDFGQQKIKGFYSGIDFDYLEGRYLGLSTGIGYYQKGAINDLSMSTLKWDLNYLTFDTKLKVKYNLNNFTPYLIIGPRIDYLIKYSSEFDEFEELADLNKINYGLRYGLGIQYDFGKFILGFGWQNNINLNSVVKNNGENIRPKFTINDKTMIFKFDIGIRFESE